MELTYPLTLLDDGENQLILRNNCIRGGDVFVADVKDRLILNPEIVIYGKKGRQNRDVGFFSDAVKSYNYSGQKMASQPLGPMLKQLLSYVNYHSGSSFNAVLVNRYNSGTDYIGAHSDNEHLDPQSGVVCASVGATRKFRIRDKVTKQILVDVGLPSGSIVCMIGPSFQSRYTHEIPVEKKVTGVRYSFTLRCHKTEEAKKRKREEKEEPRWYVFQ
jgi:alkylated DNA repair dioxygenase AlkB